MEKSKKKIVESVPNYSEGTNSEKIELIVNEIKNTPNTRIVDVQYDSDYNRAVITFVGTPEAVLKANINAAKKAIELIKTIDDEDQEAIELCRALMKKDNWGSVCNLLKKYTLDPESLRRVVLNYMGSAILNSKSHYTRVRAAMILECFRQPYYDIGKPGLIESCFSVFCELFLKST